MRPRFVLSVELYDRSITSYKYTDPIVLWSFRRFFAFRHLISFV